jgi:hypothetical protein
MNNLIIVDTREKGHKSILKYFNEHNIDYIISKLDAGDYMIYKNYSTIIDKKDGLLELSHNLCNTLEHQRVVREIELAHSLGCNNFIFLIQCNIKSEEDIKKWKSPHTKVKGEVLLKVLKTFKEHHDCKFIFVPKKDIAKKIIELLGADKDGSFNNI